MRFIFGMLVSVLMFGSLAVACENCASCAPQVVSAPQVVMAPVQTHTQVYRAAPIRSAWENFWTAREKRVAARRQAFRGLLRVQHTTSASQAAYGAGSYGSSYSMPVYSGAGSYGSSYSTPTTGAGSNGSSYSATVIVNEEE